MIYLEEVRKILVQQGFVRARELDQGGWYDIHVLQERELVYAAQHGYTRADGSAAIILLASCGQNPLVGWVTVYDTAPDDPVIEGLKTLAWRDEPRRVDIPTDFVRKIRGQKLHPFTDFRSN